MSNNEKDMLSLSVRRFIEETAAKTPTPGGGSVAGVVGALASALAEMSLNFTRGKKKYAEYEKFHAHLAGRLAKSRQMFQDLVADDVSAYQLYQDTAKREEGADKDAAMQLAVAAAIDVPREATKLALALLDDLLEFSDKCSKFLVSDLAAASALAVATVRLSNYNVRINAPNVADRAAADEIRRSSAANVQRAERTLKAIEQALRSSL